ncbi:MAG TPA: hypothetical protein VFS88_04515, partial [Micavibrio sp.]|nr:hypothetical protein [Micavibrio sp.]
MKNHILVLGAALLTLAAPQAQAQGKGAGGPTVTQVVVAAALTDKFVDKVEAIGTLRANEAITLA